MYRAKISSLSTKLHQEERRSWNFRQMYLALETVFKLGEENYTGRRGQALALAKQALAVAEQNYYPRLLHEHRQREDDLLKLIPRMLGPQMIASYNWRKINQENAGRKVMIQELESDIERQRESHNERLKEQNAEIEDLNQEITNLRAQMSAAVNPRKRKACCETEQIEPRPVNDKYIFVPYFPGQESRVDRGRGRKEKLRKAGCSDAPLSIAGLNHPKQAQFK